MKVTARTAAIAFLNVFLGVSLGYANIVLDKKSGHVIVVKDGANEVTVFAAKEFQAYAKKTLDADYVIKKDSESIPPDSKLILIGQSSYTDKLGIQFRTGAVPESFLIKTAGDTLVIIGDDDPQQTGDSITPFNGFYSRKGSVFGVYEVLERFFGVRWLFPGETGEVIQPQSSIIIPPINLYDGPAISDRWFWGMRSSETANEKFPVSERTDAQSQLWRMRMRQGKPSNLGFRNGFAHSWGEYLEGNKYYEKHPEYYAFYNGGRQKAWVKADGKPENSQTQVCTSNPDVIALFTDKIRGMCRPEDDYIVSISPNDGGGFCECPACKALDHPELYGKDDGYKGVVYSDRIFTFANAVAREVKKTHPKLKIGIIAYTFYNTPPKTIDQLESNVRIKFSEMPESYYGNPEYRRKMEKNLKEWSLKAAGGIFISEHYDDSLRIPVSHFLPLIVENTQFLSSLGIISLSMETHRYIPCRHLDYYVLSRFLWNGKQDAEALLRDYFERGYGPAGDKMRAYFDFMNKTFAGRQRETNVAANAGTVPDLWRPEDIANGGKILEAAKQSAGGADKILARIDFVARGHRFVDLFRSFAAYSRALTWAGYPIPMRGAERLQKISRHLSPEEAQTQMRETRRCYDDLVRFLRESCDVPGLDPRYLWSCAEEEGYPQAMEAYSALAEGDTSVVFREEFESGLPKGWSKLPKEAVLATERSFSGEHSLYIQNDQEKPSFLGHRMLPVEEGRQYIVSLQYQGETNRPSADAEETWSEGPTMKLQFISKDRGSLRANDGPGCRPLFISNCFNSKDKKWIPLRWVVNIPKGVNAHQMMFQLSVPNGKWWIDDVEVLQTTK